MKAMILSEFESLDNWHEKVNLMEDDNDKMIRKLIYTKLDLCSPVVKMAGFGEDSKEKLLSFLFNVAAYGWDDMKQLCRFLAEMASLWEGCSSLVGIDDFGQENLYSILVGIANSVTDTMKKQLVRIADSWKDKLGTVNEEIGINGLLLGMAVLREDNKESLYILLRRILSRMQYKDDLYRSMIWKRGLSSIRKKLDLYIFLDSTMDSCKAQVAMANSKIDSKVKQLGLLKRLEKSLKDNNETVNNERVDSLRNDIKEGNKKKLYNSLSDFCQDHKEEVYRWLIGKGDFENGKKIKLYSLVVRMREFCHHTHGSLCQLFNGTMYPWRSISFATTRIIFESVDDMADFGEDERETVYSLVVEMVDAWEHINKEKLYRLLVMIWIKENEEKEVNKENQKRLVVEISDLWEDKEKLQSLLVEVSQGIRIIDHSLAVEMARLWEENFINKVKLHSWLAKKTHHLEHNLLFRLLLDVSYRDIPIYFYRRSRSLSYAREHLAHIHDTITDNTLEEEEEEEEGSSLHYLMSEVLDHAHDATHHLIPILNSDPIALLSQILEVEEHCHYFNQTLNNMFSDVEYRLRQIKDHIHKEIAHGRDLRAKNAGNISSLKGGENLVGLEEDIKLLLHNEENHTITYIRGMAGIGKTTLARELYNHPAVINHFKCRAWVCVYEQSSHKEMLINLLRQVVDGKEFERDVPLEKMDNKSLITMLHQHLECVQYFIVFDDVEQDSYMNRVFEYLPVGAEGSRLLFTTRNPDRDFSSHEVHTEHKMRFLNEDKSWELVLKTLFFGTSDKRFPKQLERRGRRVLEKCNGLPLAIKEVGRQWTEMIGSGSKWEELLEKPIDLSATLESLDRSYQRWSYVLRNCFLHLSLFKECPTSTTIGLQKLENILRFATKESMDHLDDTSCLHDLSKNSIIELKNPTKTRHRFKMCRIIPVFQMLSITKAHDEIGLEILNKDGNNRCSHEPKHRVIYCSREKFDYSTNQDKNLVSLFFYGGGYIDTSSCYWKNFENLEILDMEDFGLKILPDAVGKLFELRYLGLRNNYIQNLPLSLGHLKKLEVLDIAQNFMVEVPDIIWEMDGLRHLYMSSTRFQLPFKTISLEHLWTLSYISVYGWTYDQLSSLETFQNVTRLGIEEVDRNINVRKLFESLASMGSLRFLTLRGFRFRRMPFLDELGILENLSTLKLEGLLTKLPSVDNFPPNITCLSLVNSCLDEDLMSILENLPELCNLKLQNAYTGQLMVISPHGFANLEYLYIGELWHLRTLQVGEGGMSKLKELEINSCPYLETLPGEIWSKKLKMVTTKNIATKLRRSRFTSGMGKVDIQP